MNTGRKDRESRILDCKGGAWASTSQDYLHLCHVFISDSLENCLRIQSNSSLHAYAIIPLLVSCIRAFFLESEREVGLFFPSEELEKVAKSQNDLLTLFELLKMDETLRKDYVLLQAVRNEIIHPAFFPPGSADNCPEYLRDLKDKGLFTTRNSQSDYIFADQITSHKLCIWAFELIETMALKIMHRKPEWGAMRFYFKPAFEKYRAYKIPDESGSGSK
jgi:hypothetical protein